MLFYLGKYVNVKEPQNAFEKKVADEIQEIKNQYFSNSTMGYVTIVYPKGEPAFGQAEWRNVWGVLKKYAVSNKGADNSWRWSSKMPAYNSKGQLDFTDPAVYVMYKTVIDESKADWLWFLLNQNHDIKAGRIYIEDLEAEAKEVNEDMAADADLRFVLFSQRSPVSANHALIKNVAEVMGIKDVSKKGVELVKNELYNLILEGEERNDRYVNTNKFYELTDGENTAKAAYEARKCIADGIVKFKDKKWFLMEGSEYAEELVSVSNQDIPYKDKVFIDEVVKNDNVRSRLFDALGIEDFVSCDDLRQLHLQVLKKKAQREVGLDSVKTTDRKEDVLKTLCKHRKIEYTEP